MNRGECVIKWMPGRWRSAPPRPHLAARAAEWLRRAADRVAERFRDLEDEVHYSTVGDVAIVVVMVLSLLILWMAPQIARICMALGWM